MTVRREFAMPPNRRSGGIGLVTAIFLLVVIMALSVAMVTIYTSQQNSSTLDVQGARAYQAARAGIEWGLFRQRIQGQCETSTFAMDANTSLRDFTVTVTCTKLEGPATAGGDADALDRWRIRSVACNVPLAGVCKDDDGVNTPDYVQRVMEVQL
ncbi:MAG: pilus assembly PilX N-terminal domain-containing protein [Telluria sp.]